MNIKKEKQSTFDEYGMWDLSFYLVDKSDKTLDGFYAAVENWARKNRLVNFDDSEFNKPYDIGVGVFDNTKNKQYSLAHVEIKDEYLKTFEKWIRSGNIYHD